MDKSDTADTEKNIDELSVRKYHFNTSSALSGKALSY